MTLELTLYRNTVFSYLTRKHWVKVMSGSSKEVNEKAAELQAKGFKTLTMYS